MEEEFDYIIKIIMVGDSGVGKSSIFGRYCEKYYNDISMSTIGVDYNIKKLDFNNNKVKLQIWDTAGQERYRTITTTYYRGAHIIMLVFDLTNECSFTRLGNWITELKKYIEHNNFILVGNKSDQIDRLQVKTDDINNFIKEHKIEYVEVSAKNNTNICQAFEKLLPELIVANPGIKRKIKSKYNSKLLYDYELVHPTDDCC